MKRLDAGGTEWQPVPSMQLRCDKRISETGLAAKRKIESLPSINVGDDSLKKSRLGQLHVDSVYCN